MKFYTILLTVSLFSVLSVFPQPPVVDKKDAGKFLKEMPAVDRVMSDYKTGSLEEYTAKQSGALYQLREMVSEIDGNSFNEMTSKEAELSKAYRTAYINIQTEMTKTFRLEDSKELGMKAPRAKWFSLRTNYELNEDMTTDLFNRYFSRKFKAHIEGIRGYWKKKTQGDNSVRREQSDGPDEGRKKKYRGSLLLISFLSLVSFVLPLVIIRLSKTGVSEGKIGNHALYQVTGTVKGQGKFSTTHVSGGGSVSQGSGSVSVYSSTTIHNDIFLVDSAGKEHSIQVSDFNVACLEGHVLTAIWAIQQGKERGPYIMVLNHSTNRKYRHIAYMSTMFRPKWRRWFLLQLIIVLFGVPYFYAINNLIPSSGGGGLFSGTEIGNIMNNLVFAGSTLAGGFFAIFSAKVRATKKAEAYVESVKFEDYLNNKSK